MFLTPQQIEEQPDIVESVEKATLRMVTHALFLYRHAATEIFMRETDLPSDIAEDITREALDTLGMSRISVRLFGKVDYKRARYHFNTNYAVQQALFVDSKAEDYNARHMITIQLSQTSLQVKQYRSGTLAGRNAPQRGEKFRVRISLARLKRKASWHVQEIPIDAQTPVWDS